MHTPPWQALLDALAHFGSSLGMSAKQLAPDGLYLNPLRLLLEMVDCDLADFAPLFAQVPPGPRAEIISRAGS